MIKIGDWLYDFRLMRGFHVDGSFVDMKWDKKSQKLLGSFQEIAYKTKSRPFMSFNRKVKEAYMNYIAEKELFR